MYNKTTSLKNFLGLFLLIGLFSVTANAQTVILSENFNSVLLGDNTTTGGSGTPWLGNTNFLVDPVNSKAYQAGGAVKLGTGSAVGFITSLPLDLSQDGGNFTVSFDVKGWTTVEGAIKVIITGLAEQTVTYTATIAGPFQNKTVTFSGGTANSTIRIETTAKRAFIDNVVVTTVPPASVDAPVATAATVTETDSFTANWNAVTGATGYKLDVSAVSDFSSFIAGFQNLTVSGTSQEVTGLAPATTYYFRVRAVNGSVTSVNSNTITATTTLATPVALEADLTDYDSFLAQWNAVTGATGYRLDVSTSPDFTSFVGAYNDFAVTNTTRLVTDLTSNTNYYYRVRAVSGDITSSNSNVIDLSTECGPFVFPDVEEAELCAGSTVADLPVNTAGYQWYATQSGGTALTATTALVEGTYYYTHTVNSCESERQSFEVTIKEAVAAPVIEIPEFEVCNSGTIADVTPEGSGYLFYTTETGGTALASTEAVTNGFLWVSQVVDGCESAARTEVEIEVEVPPMPIGLEEQTFTVGETLTDLEVAAEEQLLWFADEALTISLGTTTLLEDGTVYYAVNNDGGCYSEALAVTANQALGNSAFAMAGLVTYPNPVKDLFTISYTQPVTNVTVYNMLSQVVATTNDNSGSVKVNMSGLAAGTYFVKVQSGTESKTIKVVKQ